MGSISVVFLNIWKVINIKLSNATEKITFLPLEGHKGDDFLSSFWRKTQTLVETQQCTKDTWQIPPEATLLHTTSWPQPPTHTFTPALTPKPTAAAPSHPPTIHIEYHPHYIHNTKLKNRFHVNTTFTLTENEFIVFILMWNRELPYWQIQRWRKQSWRYCTINKQDINK